MKRIFTWNDRGVYVFSYAVACPSPNGKVTYPYRPINARLRDILFELYELNLKKDSKVDYPIVEFIIEDNPEVLVEIRML
jgi:hypothetical protein